MQDKNMKNNIKSQSYPKSETVRDLEKYCYKAKCIVRWAEEHTKKMSVDSIQS